MPDGTCFQCPAGYWCDDERQIKCPDNSTSLIGSSNLTDCFCVPGFATNGSECEVCPVTKYCPGHGEVVDCPLYATSPAGSIEVDDCYCSEGWASLADGSCEPICGDGISQEIEACDDGGRAPLDGCSANCTVERGWICRYGSLDGPDVCVPLCGDGYRLESEQSVTDCDDGNTIDGDGCSFYCTIECGFVCAQAIAVNGSSADVCIAQCGDGIRANTEECDDGNSDDYDGCSASCIIEDLAGWQCTMPSCSQSECSCGWNCSDDTGALCTSSCGDGILASNSVEQCDDGNFVNGDGCSDACTIEDGWYVPIARPCNTSILAPICGDGRRLGDEECDDGNLWCWDGCSDACTVECGWTCEQNLGGDTCSAVCGDGLSRGGEACDDGNTEDNDGCSELCTIEDGFVCAGAEDLTCNAINSECSPGACGTGQRGPVKECDDGNLDNGDGCNSLCQIERGWSCVGGITADNCTVGGCGDGLRAQGIEGCDDANLDNLDGCSSTCTVESGWICERGCGQVHDDCVCDAGYGYDNAGRCVPCEIGSYKSEVGQASCTVCPPGSTTLDTTSTSYDECTCGDGFVVEDDGCLDIDECASLVPCASNATCENTPGSFACNCEPGYGNTAGGLACRVCEPGSYRGSYGTGECFLCAAGKFSNNYGQVEQTDCLLCPENTTSLAGSSSCDCAPGFFFENGKCVECPAGTYSAELGSLLCLSCPEGSTSKARSASCICAAGYQDTGGLCVPCKSGTFNSEPGSDVCTPCSTDNPYSPAGSVSALQCTTDLSHARHCDAGEGGQLAWCRHSLGDPRICYSSVSQTQVIRRGQSAVVAENFAVLFGGELPGSGKASDSVRAETFVLDFQLPRFRWRMVATQGLDAPAPRLYHSSVVEGDQMFVFGGLDARTGDVMSDLWALHLGHWEWRQMLGPETQPSATFARHSHSAVSIQNLMLVFGGKASTGGSCLSDVWKMDLSTAVWTMPETNPPAVCWGQAAAMSSSEGVILLDTSGTALWKLSLAGWIWQDLSSSLHQRTGGMATYANLVPSALVSIEPSCRNMTTCSVWILDTTTLQWNDVQVTTGISTGTDVMDAATALSVNGQYLFLGHGESSDRVTALTVGAVRPQYLSLSQSETVQLAGEGPTARERAAAFVINDAMFLFG
eukprot:501695-Rhodomonas_salina.1